MSKRTKMMESSDEDDGSTDSRVIEKKVRITVTSTSTTISKATTIKPLPTNSETEEERLARITVYTTGDKGLESILKGLIVDVPKLAMLSALTTTTLNTKKKMKSNYWNPELGRVYNCRTPDDGGLKLEQIIGSKDEGVLGESHPHTAIMSSYSMNQEWLGSLFKEETVLLLVTFEPNEYIGKNFKKIRLNSKSENIYIRYPETKRGNMHAKFCILYYDTYMRVVIPTANFVDYDWHTIDNAFFIQDFPLLTLVDTLIIDPKLNPTHTTSFSLPLLTFLQHLNLHESFLNPFLLYDFDLSDEIRLVHSLHGTWYEGDNRGGMKAGGGLVSLSQAIKSLNFGKNGKWEIEATGSSIGNYSNNWLAQFLGSAQGICATKYFSRKSLTPPSLSPIPSAGTKWKVPIKIVFPTLNAIDTSLGGRISAGTLFCPLKNWKGNSPRHLFHKGECKNRAGIIAHTKLIVAIKKIGKKEEKKGANEGWLYVGSHNFTAAAWGRLENSDSNGPQIRIMNYELGVVLPIRADSAKSLERYLTKLSTFVRPLERYESDDLPWTENEADQKAMGIYVEV